MAYYSRPEEILVRFKDIFDANKELLGFQQVVLQDENLFTEYPTLEIVSGQVRREIHGTQKFLVNFETTFWIYHANFEATHMQRSVEDMELATAVVHFLHQPKMRVLEDPSDPGSNKNKLIFSWVVEEVPGVLSTDKRGVVTTRLVWNGQSEVNFDRS